MDSLKGIPKIAGTYTHRNKDAGDVPKKVGSLIREASISPNVANSLAGIPKKHGTFSTANKKPMPKVDVVKSNIASASSVSSVSSASSVSSVTTIVEPKVGSRKKLLGKITSVNDEPDGYSCICEHNGTTQSFKTFVEVKEGDGISAIITKKFVRIVKGKDLGEWYTIGTPWISIAKDYSTVADWLLKKTNRYFVSEITSKYDDIYKYMSKVAEVYYKRKKNITTLNDRVAYRVLTAFYNEFNVRQLTLLCISEKVAKELNSELVYERMSRNPFTCVHLTIDKCKELFRSLGIEWTAHQEKEATLARQFREFANSNMWSSVGITYANNNKGILVITPLIKENLIKDNTEDPGVIYRQFMEPHEDYDIIIRNCHYYDTEMYRYEQIITDKVTLLLQTPPKPFKKLISGGTTSIVGRGATLGSTSLGATLTEGRGATLGSTSTVGRGATLGSTSIGGATLIEGRGATRKTKPLPNTFPKYKPAYTGSPKTKSLNRPVLPKPRLTQLPKSFGFKPTSKSSILLDESQQMAVNMALSQPISIITGGAGTGKTTTILEIVNNIEAIEKEYLVVSYTGKAVARLKEVLKDIKQQPLTCKLAVTTADIIPKFEYLIIDEASMISYAVLGEFLATFTHPYSMIFVGDVDQLPPIESGCVMYQLACTRMVKICFLQKNYRNNNVVDSVVCQVIRPCRENYDTSLSGRLLNPNNMEEHVTKLAKMHVVKIITPYVEAATEINVFVRDIYNPSSRSNTSGKNKFRIGDTVMMIKNDYNLMIMNGDEGSVLGFEDCNGKVKAEFSTPSGEKKEVYVYPSSLELSYALTVHKSQGSQWKYVVFYLPTYSKGFFVDRHLIYTALSRAQDDVWVIANYHQLLTMSCAAPKYRHDNLASEIIKKLTT